MTNPADGVDVTPTVGVIMGSDSDYDGDAGARPPMRWTEFDVPHEVRVVSAHRTPLAMAELRAGRRPGGGCG